VMERSLFALQAEGDDNHVTLRIGSTLFQGHTQVVGRLGFPVLLSVESRANPSIGLLYVHR
jgi:hypothetical protein